MKYVLGMNKEDYVSNLKDENEMREERDFLIPIMNDLKMNISNKNEEFLKPIEKEYDNIKLHIYGNLRYNQINVSIYDNLISFYIGRKGDLKEISSGYSLRDRFKTFLDINNFNNDCNKVKEFIPNTDVDKYFNHFSQIENTINKNQRYLDDVEYIINWITTYLKNADKPTRKMSKERMIEMKDFFQVGVTYYMYEKKMVSKYNGYDAFYLSPDKSLFIFGTVNRQYSTGKITFHEPYRSKRNRLIFNNKNVESIYNYVNRKVIVKIDYDRTYKDYIYLKADKNYKTSIEEKFNVIEISPEEYKRYTITGEIL